MIEWDNGSGVAFEWTVRECVHDKITDSGIGHHFVSFIERPSIVHADLAIEFGKYGRHMLGQNGCQRWVVR